MTIEPRNETFNDSDTVTLMCMASGGPGNTFQWTFNGEEIQNETSSNLTRTNVTESDGGAYTCTVTNPAGSGSYTTHVFISPRITMNPTSVNASLGSEISFTCNATGFPEPEIQWMKENGSLPSSASGRNTTTLTIGPVSFGDEGLYYCVATSNQLSAESERATLYGELSFQWSYLSSYYHVTLHSIVSPEGSVRVTPPQIDAERNTNATFMCFAQGGPGNMFSWSKLPDEVTITESSELVIMVDSASVGGTYQCTVENMAGSDSSTAVLNGEICVFLYCNLLFFPVLSLPPCSYSSH